MNMETVLKEFPPVGRYRVRLIQTKNGSRLLDVREFLTSEGFEGFTRRGIRLTELPMLDLLSDILSQVRSEGGIEEKPLNETEEEQC